MFLHTYKCNCVCFIQHFQTKQKYYVCGCAIYWRYKWPECTRHTIAWFDGLNQAVVIKRLIVLSSSQFISCVGSHGACHHGEITQMLSWALPTQTHNQHIGGSQCTHSQTYLMSSTDRDNVAAVWVWYMVLLVWGLGKLSRSERREECMKQKAP